jgi:hypothetical protein
MKNWENRCFLGSRRYVGWLDLRGNYNDGFSVVNHIMVIFLIYVLHSNLGFEKF